MTNTFLSLEQLAAVYKTEEDWLFEKHLEMLNDKKNLILTADHGFGIQEYVNELGFQLAEKYPDIHNCYMDMKPAHNPESFLEVFVASLSQAFPEVISRINLDDHSIDLLKLPAIIAHRKRIRIAVYIANSHLFHRFRDQTEFLRTLKLKLRNQKNCVFCLYGSSNPYFRDLVMYPESLSGFGRRYEIRRNLTDHRSASIRKLFHDHGEKIGHTTSVQMSYLMNNHPFYLKLLSWHVLIRTHHTCTTSIVERALNDLIHHFDHHYYKKIETLTPKQIHFLNALVDGVQKFFTKDAREKYQLGSTSNVSRIKLSLERREIIDAGKFETVISDPIFKEWLRRFYFAGTM